VTRSRRFFGSHFALYYRILYKIAIKVRNLEDLSPAFKHTFYPTQ
jgi:hypothetical protein